MPYSGLRGVFLRGRPSLRAVCTPEGILKQEQNRGSSMGISTPRDPMQIASRRD